MFRSRLVVSLILLVFWKAVALLILLPPLGIAWGVSCLTDLTFAEACLVTLGYGLVLVYIFRVHMECRGINLWLLALWSLLLSLSATILEGILLRNLVDLTTFQAILVVGSVNLLFAYTFTHSMIGYISQLLLGLAFGEPVEAWEEENLEEAVFSSPIKSRSKGGRRKSRNVRR